VVPASHSPTSEPRLRWLFLDLNSYFASVEQELRPELRNRPVAVVPVMADTTCCIAASYEAKAFKVKTGTQVGEAKRMCPGIELVEARHELYVEYHRKIVTAVETCVPVATVMSIDEMACSLMGREQPLVAALDLARRVKETIKREVGSTLRCSVGLAPNRYLAKIASDMEKPDGLVALTPDILKPALQQLVLRDLPGVGARMEQHLNARGIRTMEQLLALDHEKLSEVWGGVGGEKLYHWLRGEDFNDPKLDHQKSISQSHMLAPEFRTRDGAYAVGVWLGNLVPDHLHTLSLFSNLESEARRTRLSTTMDELNHKYGLDTLFPASMLVAKAAAPTRIAFTSIPDLFE
jgi:DNA polymerase-4